MMARRARCRARAAVGVNVEAFLLFADFINLETREYEGPWTRRHPAILASSTKVAGESENWATKCESQWLKLAYYLGKEAGDG